MRAENTVKLQHDVMKLAPIDEPICAIVKAPPSKSYTHRALIVSALADGESLITNPLLAEDTQLTLQALKDLGVVIENEGTGIKVKGTNGKLTAHRKEIMLNNSGTSFRLLLSVASLATDEVILTGNNLLCQRPILDLVEALNNLGVKCRYLRKNGFPPVAVKSRLKGGFTSIRSDKSSQYLSSILLCSPYALTDVTIESSTKIRSKPYVTLTLDVMEKFGVTPIIHEETYTISTEEVYTARNYAIEGDYSSASYFFAIAAVLGGQITVKGLNPNSKQADRIFLNFLEKMGCKITYHEDAVTVQRSLDEPMKGIDVDLSNSPDIVQTLAVVAAFASTPTSIRNISHLKYKEINRLTSTAKELEKIGSEVDITNEDMKINPICLPRQAIIETYNDHRMAMAFSIAALKLPKIMIKNPICVQKSFPTFFQILHQLYNQREEAK